MFVLCGLQFSQHIDLKTNGVLPRAENLTRPVMVGSCIKHPSNGNRKWSLNVTIENTHIHVKGLLCTSIRINAFQCSDNTCLPSMFFIVGMERNGLVPYQKRHFPRQFERQEESSKSIGEPMKTLFVRKHIIEFTIIQT